MVYFSITHNNSPLSSKRTGYVGMIGHDRKPFVYNDLHTYTHDISLELWELWSHKSLKSLTFQSSQSSHPPSLIP